MSAVDATLTDELWLWQDADGVWRLSLAPDRWPGARVPRPYILPEGTQVSLTVWHAGCPGCTRLRSGDPVEGVVEHTHGRP